MDSHTRPIPAVRPSVDMSPEAIDRRLRVVAELYRFGLALRSAKRVGALDAEGRVHGNLPPTTFCAASPVPKVSLEMMPGVMRT